MDIYPLSDWRDARSVRLHDTGKRYLARGSAGRPPKDADRCDRLQVRHEAPAVILVRCTCGDLVHDVLHSGAFTVEYAPTEVRISVADIMLGDELEDGE